MRKANFRTAFVAVIILSVIFPACGPENDPELEAEKARVEEFLQERSRYMADWLGCSLNDTLRYVCAADTICYVVDSFATAHSINLNLEKGREVFVLGDSYYKMAPQGYSGAHCKMKLKNSNPERDIVIDLSLSGMFGDELPWNYWSCQIKNMEMDEKWPIPGDVNLPDTVNIHDLSYCTRPRTPHYYEDLVLVKSQGVVSLTEWQTGNVWTLLPRQSD